MLSKREERRRVLGTNMSSSDLSYGATEPLHNGNEGDVEEETFVTIEVKEGDEAKATLAPIGARLKRNAQIEYNPYNWKQTLLAWDGRPHVSTAFYVVSGIQTTLVLMSGLAGIGVEDDRHCRAWCSRFALGAQPHQYVGFCLFLLTAFRTNQAYRMYLSGQSAWYAIKENLRIFVQALLSSIPRDAVSAEKRARMVAFAIAFPFSLAADLREERKYEKHSIEHVLEEKDLKLVCDAPTMPLYVLESLSSMVLLYCSGEDVPNTSQKTMIKAIVALHKPYSECERIQNNPCAFAYVAHLRLLLVTYLTTLPLALVEAMGFSTIPVCCVITYALMSLEMLAVEVESPFGFAGSDLNLFEYNLQIKESLLESWKRWQEESEAVHLDLKRQSAYAKFDTTKADFPREMSWDKYW